MKANSAIFTLLILLLMGCATQRPAQSPAVLEQTKQHRRIAIIPFYVTFSPGYLEELYRRKKRNLSFEEFAWEHQRTAGLELQFSFYKQVTKQIERGKMNVVCLDVLQTNRLLAEQNIVMRDLHKTPVEWIAKALQVDAVILGETDINMDRRAIAWGGVDSKIRLYDTQKGAVLMTDETNERFNRPMDTPAYLANNTVLTLARRLPYGVSGQR